MVEPIATKYLIQGKWQFMTDNEYSQYELKNFWLTDEEVMSVSYWSNKGMEALIADSQNRKDYDGHPEYCRYNSEVGSNPVRDVLAYIDNVPNPYVRVDKDINVFDRESLLDRRGNPIKYFSESMAKKLNKFPIIGYGFPAYLAIHSLSNNGKAELYDNPSPCIGHNSSSYLPANPTICDTLFAMYYSDRYELYKAVHSSQYTTWRVRLNSKYERSKAEKELARLDNSFNKTLLEQEQQNIALSKELAELFNGELDDYFDYFINYLQDKVEGTLSNPVSKVNNNRTQKQVGNNKPQQTTTVTISDEMVEDFKARFGEDEKSNYREILQHIAPLTNSKIAHYLYNCKFSLELINKEVRIMDLWQWLSDNKFHVKKYDTFKHVFK